MSSDWIAAAPNSFSNSSSHRHQRIQITTADYSSVHLLLPADHTAAASFANLVITRTQVIDHIRQPHEPDTAKAEPVGAKRGHTKG